MTICRIVTIAALAILCGCTALEAEPYEVAAAQYDRDQMAQLHEKMAACLRSDSPLAECRSEMMQDCQSMKHDEDGHKCGMGMMGCDRQPQAATDKPDHSDHKH